MGGDSFRFKQFNVKQCLSAMKVGTDGVIIGAWAALDGHEKRILDVGTGTGLIAMMIAQRAEAAMVDAVEIERGAAGEAAENFDNSPFAQRIKIYTSDFQSFAKSQSEANIRYDLIVSNPPYFNGTYKSIDAQRTAARHSELLPSNDLIEGVMRLIEPERGRFAAIFPYSDAAVFIAKAAAMGLYCNRLLEVLPKTGRAAKRMAAEFSPRRSLEVNAELLTILDDESQYCEQFRRLTADFYLKF